MSMKSFLRSLGVEISITRNEVYERHPQAKELLDQFVMAQAKLVRHTNQYQHTEQMVLVPLEVLMKGNERLRKVRQAWIACRNAGVTEEELNVLGNIGRAAS